MIQDSAILRDFTSYSNTGSGSWSNVDNVKTDDATYATTGNISYNAASALRLSYAGSLFAFLPDGAVVTSVKGSSTCKQDSGTGTWTGILYRGSATLGSRTGSTGSVGTGDTEESYTWSGSIAAADVKSSGIDFESKLQNRRLLGVAQSMRRAYIEIAYRYEDRKFSIKIGTADVTKMSKGNTEITKVFKGNQEL